MCIRDSVDDVEADYILATHDPLAAMATADAGALDALLSSCLLYTSDAADERSSVDLGGRRIIKKKNMCIYTRGPTMVNANSL